MKIWTTGIIEAEVNPAFFATRQALQLQLNKIASANNFGDAVEEICVVFVVSRDVITEIRRFYKKSKTLDIRVNINYTEFLEASASHRVLMFVEALKGMLHNTNNFNASQFDKELLVSRLSELS